MNIPYLTVDDNFEHEIIIDKSRFICYLSRAKTEVEAVAFIQKIKKLHYNANHNCSAYIVGEDRMKQKASDDGEPSGTAGVPMLEVLRKNNLTDIVVVVTRYFGGIKLGAGGLIRAYGGAVSESIKLATIVQIKQMQVIEIETEYSHIGILDSLLVDYQITNKTYLEKVTYDVIVDISSVDKFSTWFTDATNGKIQFVSKGIILTEVIHNR